MALFVHITAQKYISRIRRAGIKANPIGAGRHHGIYAMPIVLNFYTSHQWVRELKRGGQRQMWGVYFRVPDAEEVWVGRYHQPHTHMTAAEAVAMIRQLTDAQGYEVIIPHAIAARAIIKIRDVPHIGWRYFPSAHGQHPCGCPACLRRGEFKSRRIRKAYKTQFE
jgi:hypothetical protein